MEAALKGLKVLKLRHYSGHLRPCIWLIWVRKLCILSRRHVPIWFGLMPPYANGQATAHSYLNRKKQSIALDLKDPKSIELIKAKISDFDIVVEVQFRPGVMQRLGLDYEVFAEINPRLIYCSITGYGQTGHYKDRAGHDINYLALSGISGHSGRQDRGPPPMGFKSPMSQADQCMQLLAFLAAVIERYRSGLGQYIDISMTDCAVALNNMAAAGVLAANAVTAGRNCTSEWRRFL